jgi:hypothetical protein
MLVFTGCHLVSSAPPISPDPEGIRRREVELRENLLTLIPVGTMRDSAMRIAKNNNLEVHIDIDPKTKVQVLAGEYTDKRTSMGGRIWQVRIEFINDNVTDIKVRWQRDDTLELRYGKAAE